MEELSLADSVFGWVNQDPQKAAGENQSAIKARVRVGAVNCLSDDAIEKFDQPHTLAILGEPKVQQGRFYLGDSKGKKHARGIQKSRVGYRNGNRLRGPKVFPHHAAGINQQTAFSNSPGKQNRSIKSWVRPEKTFQFDLQVLNLSAIEMGALVWLLTLPAEHYLKFGYGKPLGFGSVQVELEQARIAGGSDWASSLTKWKINPDCLSETQLEEVKAGFEQAITASNSSLLNSFLRSAAGFGQLPIHYPRLPRQGPADGKHFEWFVENEKGHKHSLPDLYDADVSLPKSP